MSQDKFQGYLISQYLYGFGLESIPLIDPLGLDPYFNGIFHEIKRVYDDKGIVALDELSFGIDKAVELMDHYGYMSFSIDSCIESINKNAYNKNIHVISESLKNGNITPSEAIEKLNQIGTEKSEMLIDISDIEYRTLSEQAKNTLETGFYEYDSHVEDWKPGELTVIFGRNGEGKTTFVSQIIGHMVYQNKKTFLYSGEMSNNKIQDWLYRQIVGAGKEYYDQHAGKYGMKYELKKDIVSAIKKWHEGKLFLYNRDAKKKVRSEIDRLFSTMELAVKKGVKVFFIDNLMAILEENADSLYSDQANFVQRCKNFTTNKNVHVVLMAHPNKEKKEITDEKGNLDKTDISGSNNIANKADNIIAIERVWTDERQFDAIITSLKDRETGQRKVIKMLFSKSTLRFYNNVTKQSVEYDWKKYHTKPMEVDKRYLDAINEVSEGTIF